MSANQIEKEARAWAFAQALVVAAKSRATSIVDSFETIPQEMRADIADWLNARGLETADEKPWTTDSTASFWNRNSDMVLSLCRTITATKSNSPAIERILELWADGIPVVAILAILLQEGFTDEAGLQFTPESIAEAIDAYEKEQLPFMHDQAAATNSSLTDDRFVEQPTDFDAAIAPVGETKGLAFEDGTGNFDPAKAGEPWVTREELELTLKQLHTAFRHELELMAQTLRSEVQDSMQGARDSQKTPTALPPLPPQAPLEELKKLGSRVKISVTIDAELMRLLETERKLRNITLSTMIDAMAWHYFKRPKLSFERLREEQGQERLPFRDPSDPD